MLVLVSLVLGRVIEPADAFTGFSSFAVLTIAGLMVIGDGLERTGVVKRVARSLEKVIRNKYNWPHPQTTAPPCGRAESMHHESLLVENPQ